MLKKSERNSRVLRGLITCSDCIIDSRKEKTEGNSTTTVCTATERVAVLCYKLNQVKWGITSCFNLFLN